MQNMAIRRHEHNEHVRQTPVTCEVQDDKNQPMKKN